MEQRALLTLPTEADQLWLSHKGRASRGSKEHASPKLASSDSMKQVTCDMANNSICVRVRRGAEAKPSNYDTLHRRICMLALRKLSSSTHQRLIDVTPTASSGLYHLNHYSHLPALDNLTKTIQLLVQDVKSRDSSILEYGAVIAGRPTEAAYEGCRLGMLLPVFQNQDKHGDTILHKLAYSGPTTLLEAVIDRLISTLRIAELLQIQNKSHVSVLHLLAKKRLTHLICKALGSVDMEDRLGLLSIADCDLYTPFHHVIMTMVDDREETHSLSKLLCQLSECNRFQLLKLPNRHGETALHMAAENSSGMCVTGMLKSVMLSDRFELLRDQNRDGKTPLMISIIQRSKDLINLMLNFCEHSEQRVELIKISDMDGNTALDLSSGCTELNRLLLQHLKMPNYADHHHGNGAMFSPPPDPALDLSLNTKPDVYGKYKDENWGGLPLPPDIRSVISASHVSIARLPSSPVYKLNAQHSEDYRKMSVRLQTYYRFENSCVPKYSLASAGFIYMNRGDEVACLWCDLALHEFKEYVNPLAIHKAYSQEVCEFLINTSLNEAIEELCHNPSTQTGGKMGNTENTDSGFLSGPLSSERPSLTASTAADSGVGSLSLETASLNAASAVLLEMVKPDVIMLHADETNATLPPPSDTKSLLTRYQHYEQQSAASDAFTKDILSKRPSELSDTDMHAEVCRIGSFLRQEWARSVAEQLAATGMYLIDSSKETYSLVCAFCHGTVDHVTKNQIPADSALKLHITRFPSCPFLRGDKPSANIPWISGTRGWLDMQESLKPTTSAPLRLEGYGITTPQAKNPELAVIDRRKQTFLTLPHDHPKRPDELADAGYYYEGKGYAVRCFSCDIISDDWSFNDDVWKRHACSSSSCQFIQLQRGPAFVESAIAELGVYRPPPPQPRLTNITKRNLRPRMDSRVVQKTLAMGYEPTHVKTVVTNRLQALAHDYCQTADLVKDVLALKVPEIHLAEGICLPRLSRPPIDPSMEEDSELPSVPTDSEQISIAKAEVSEEKLLEEPPEMLHNKPEDSESVQKVASEIINQLTCKICTSDIVSIIFLPCGHLVCCTSCAAAMVECPLCRQVIRGTIKVRF